MTREEQVKAQVQIITVVGEAIRDLCAADSSGLGGVPSGHLYAALMPTFTLAQYESVIGVLERAGLVEEKNHLLTWTGPKS